MRFLLLLLALSTFADDEIFINQTGNGATIKLEQLGSGNLIGGTSASSGSMTALDLDGIDMTLTINQIGSNNIFRSDAIDSDYVTAYFNFDGDSNVYDMLLNSGALYSADYANLNVQVTGSSNTFDVNIAENSNADYENATNYVDIFGDSNQLTFAGSGYAGTSASDSGYFYLDLTGSNNTYNITQSSTLARDWLKIESNTSNSTICIVQNDGGTATSC
jgi:hypothetical protein